MSIYSRTQHLNFLLQTGAFSSAVELDFTFCVRTLLVLVRVDWNTLDRLVCSSVEGSIILRLVLCYILDIISNCKFRALAGLVCGGNMRVVLNDLHIPK